eukprot:976959-Pelagomonas_calceolata.AAC.3
MQYARRGSSILRGENLCHSPSAAVLMHLCCTVSRPQRFSAHAFVMPCATTSALQYACICAALCHNLSASVRMHFCCTVSQPQCFSAHAFVLHSAAPVGWHDTSQHSCIGNRAQICFFQAKTTTQRRCVLQVTACTCLVCAQALDLEMRK